MPVVVSCVSGSPYALVEDPVLQGHSLYRMYIAGFPLRLVGGARRAPSHARSRWFGMLLCVSSVAVLLLVKYYVYPPFRKPQFFVGFLSMCSLLAFAVLCAFLSGAEDASEIVLPIFLVVAFALFALCVLWREKSALRKSCQKCFQKQKLHSIEIGVFSVLPGAPAPVRPGHSCHARGRLAVKRGQWARAQIAQGTWGCGAGRGVSASCLWSRLRREWRWQAWDWDQGKTWEPGTPSSRGVPRDGGLPTSRLYSSWPNRPLMNTERPLDLRRLFLLHAVRVIIPRGGPLDMVGPQCGRQSAAHPRQPSAFGVLGSAPYFQASFATI